MRTPILVPMAAVMAAAVMAAVMAAVSRSARAADDDRLGTTSLYVGSAPVITISVPARDPRAQKAVVVTELRCSGTDWTTDLHNGPIGLDAQALMPDDIPDGAPIPSVHAASDGIGIVVECSFEDPSDGAPAMLSLYVRTVW